MLKYNLTRVLRSQERDIAPGVNITAEGTPLVAVYSGGEFVGVKPCAGAAGEKFLGFSQSQQLAPLTLALASEFTVAAAAGSLPKTAISGTIRLVDVTTGVTLTAGSAANANEYEVDGNLRDIVFNAGQNGHVIRAFQRYSPTLLEARSAQGDILPGGAASLQYGRIGAIEAGDVYTSEFDTTVDWAATASVKLAPNGLLTGAAGSGVAIASAVVISVPTPAYPFLGLRIGVAL